MEKEWGNGRRMRKWKENEEMEREWGNGERMMKLRGNGENMRKLRGNGERMRKWSARQNEREEEFHLCISLSLLQNIKHFTFWHNTLKCVTFCREMLKYGECRKNVNIRVMRKWFWIKSGCEEAPQVVPAWYSPINSIVKGSLLLQYRREFGDQFEKKGRVQRVYWTSVVWTCLSLQPDLCYLQKDLSNWIHIKEQCQNGYSPLLINADQLSVKECLLRQPIYVSYIRYMCFGPFGLRWILHSVVSVVF